MEQKDQTLVCVDCGEEFVFEAGEAEHYSRHGYPPPKRCKFCRMELRRKRKAEQLRGGRRGPH